MASKPYLLTLPEDRSTSVVFASPHSGREYSWSFLRKSMLDERTIRSSEDAFVDRLFEAAPMFGAPFLAATAPRAFLDLNRAPDEFDPALIEGARPTSHNPRVVSGLGVIPRVVAGGKAIHRGKISLQEANTRVANFWRPYHDTLQSLLSDSLMEFGEAILIDCHSMPHEAMEGLGPASAPRAEIVLGDRFGAAAHAEIVDHVEAAFQSVGLRVARNSPFAGAFITQHYGRPSRRQHVVQVEIDRSLYMDEKNVLPNRKFREFRRMMRQVIADVVQVGRRRISVAAE